MKDTVRNTMCLAVGFIVLWYAGAMVDFFPFAGDDLAIRAAGFTGLLVVLAVAACACWVVAEIRKKK